MLFFAGLIPLPAEITTESKVEDIVSSINSFLKRKLWLILLVVYYTDFDLLPSNLFLSHLHVGLPYNLGTFFRLSSSLNKINL